MLNKPKSCRGCSLYKSGKGFSKPDGSCSNGVLVIGEALGKEEVRKGLPFQGQAGAQRNITFHKGSLTKDEFGWWNAVACQPPKNWLEGAPWQYSSISHCHHHFLSVLSDFRPKVLVPLGNVATEKLLLRKGIERLRGYVYDYECAINREDVFSCLVLPTYHPSFIMRGQHNLTGVHIHDFKKALTLSSDGEQQIHRRLITNPSLSDAYDFLEQARRLCQSNENIWMTADIETAFSAKLDEDKYDDIKDSEITRISFAFSPDYGISIPWSASFYPVIRKLLALPSAYYCFWNADFDVPRLRAKGFDINAKILDSMWMWHFYQSDLPKGLGFVSTFFTDLREWKSLAQAEPEYYSCVDSVACIENTYGIRDGLITQRRLHAFLRDIVDLDPVIKEMSRAGIIQDQAAKEELLNSIKTQREELFAQLQREVPDDVKPRIERKVLSVQQQCWRCRGTGKEPDKAKLKALKITIKHLMEHRDEGIDGELFTGPTCILCKGEGKINKQLKPDGSSATVEGFVSEGNKWVKLGEFLPSSSEQVQHYIEFKGHPMPLDHKTKRPTTGQQELERLAKRYKKDKVYPLILKIRGFDKSSGQYLEGYEPDEDGRVRTEFGYHPSTLRFSSRRPNVQNIPNPSRAIDEADIKTAMQIRNLYCAAPGKILYAADYVGIEALLAGWYADDEQYMEICKRGAHGFLASYQLVTMGEWKDPISISWPDDQIKAAIKDIKKNFPNVYARVKPVTHGSAFGGTAYRFKMENPQAFPTVKSAEELQLLFFQQLAPKLHLWQWRSIIEAEQEGYLENVFGYRHYFWKPLEFYVLKKGQANVSKKEVYMAALDRIERGFIGQEMTLTFGGTEVLLKWGQDSRRLLGFRPQSTAAGVMRRAIERIALTDYRSALRWTIHDELVFELDDDPITLPWKMKELNMLMSYPVIELGGLSIEVEGAAGKRWGDCK